MNEENKTYNKKFYCNNCGETFCKYFEFGQVAHKGNCPRCGVSDRQLENTPIGIDTPWYKQDQEAIWKEQNKIL